MLLTATSFPRDAADWRGRFIYDQAAALARQGQRVTVWSPPGELPPGTDSALTPDDARWFETLSAQGGIAHLLRRRPWRGIGFAWQLLQRQRAACRRVASADYYLVNWLQNALALPDDGRPTIVTALGSDFGLLRLPGMAGALRRQFRRHRTVLMPNAAWMATRLQAQFGEVARIEPNPFGVAPVWFSVERSPQTAGWLVVTRITRGKLGHLLAWGEGLFSPARPLHLLGPMQEEIDLPGWITYHGATNPAELCTRWFPQALGLLTLSRHDEGRPQVMIEAMAAGLPVIASDIPAHADLIRHGETGWLVGTREELAAGLAQVEATECNLRLGQHACEWIKQTVGTWDDCAARYIAAGCQLLGQDDAA